MWGSKCMVYHLTQELSRVEGTLCCPSGSTVSVRGSWHKQRLDVCASWIKDVAIVPVILSVRWVSHSSILLPGWLLPVVSLECPSKPRGGPPIPLRRGEEDKKTLSPQSPFLFPLFPCHRRKNGTAGEFLVEGLDPFTLYEFDLCAMSSRAAGPFCDNAAVKTLEDRKWGAPGVAGSSKDG